MLSDYNLVLASLAINMSLYRPAQVRPATLAILTLSNVPI